MLEHPEGRVHVVEAGGGRRRIAVEPHDPALYVPIPQCETAYPLELNGDVSMPDFAPPSDGHETSAELTAALLEPEAALEAEEDEENAVPGGSDEPSADEFLRAGSTFDADEAIAEEEPDEEKG